MTDTAIISAVSPIASGLVMGLLYWGWRKFIRRLDENRDVTLGAVNQLGADFAALSNKVVLHQGEDTTMFNAQGERIARLEGGQAVLTQIAAAQATREKPNA